MSASSVPTPTPLEWESFPVSPSVPAPQAVPLAAGSGEPKATPSITSLSFYKVMFEHDDIEIFTRLKYSLNPSTFQDLLTRISEKPDWNVSFWISATFTFALYAASITWSNSSSLEKLGGNAEGVITSISTIFGFTFMVPIGLRFLLNYLNAAVFPHEIPQLISLYGYSLVPFVFAAMLSAIPINFLTWIITLAAGLYSTWFLLQTIFFPIAAIRDHPSIKFIAVYIIVLQMGLALTTKLIFF